MSNEPNATSTTVSASLGITPNGTVIYDHNGSSGANGQVLVAVGDGTLLWESAGTGGVSQLIAGTGITLSPTNGLGVVTINAEIGVTQLIAGANITLSPTDGLGTVTITANDSSVPGGSNTDIQFNNSGAFDGTADLTYFKAGNIIPTISLGAVANLGEIQIGSGPSFTITCLPISNYSQINDATGTLIIATSGNLNLNPEVSLQINGDPGTSGYVLTSQGPSSPPIWAPASGGGGTPGGSNGQLQYNNSGVFAGLTSGTAGQALVSQGSGLPPTWTVGPVGTVTSVQLADTSTTPIYGVSGGPITTYGTINLTLTSQAPNTVFAGPATGGAAQPAFRALVAADIPSPTLTATYVGFGSSGNTLTGSSNLTWTDSTQTLDAPNGITITTESGNDIHITSSNEIYLDTQDTIFISQGGTVYGGLQPNVGGGIAISSQGVLDLTMVMELQINNSAGTSGQVLTSQGSGSPPIWSTVSASPGGSNTQLQYNNSGVFGGTDFFYYNNSTLGMTVGSSTNTTPTITLDPNVSSAGLTVEGAFTVGPYNQQGITIQSGSGVAASGNGKTVAYSTPSIFNAAGGETNLAPFSGQAHGGAAFAQAGNSSFFTTDTGRFAPANAFGGFFNFEAGIGVSSSSVSGLEGSSYAGGINFTTQAPPSNLLGQSTLSGGAGYTDGTYEDTLNAQCFSWQGPDNILVYSFTVVGGAITAWVPWQQFQDCTVGDVNTFNINTGPNCPYTGATPTTAATMTVDTVVNNGHAGSINFTSTVGPINFSYGIGNEYISFQETNELSLNYDVGTAGEVLTSQGAGSAPIWSTVTAGAGGSSGEIQWNNAGALDGLPTSTWDGTNLVLAGATTSGVNGGDITVQGGLNTLGANGGNVHIYSGDGDNNNGYIELSTGGPLSPGVGSVVIGAYGSGVVSITATNTMQVSIGGSAGTTGQVLGSDGAGNVEWTTSPGVPTLSTGVPGGIVFFDGTINRYDDDFVYQGNGNIILGNNDDISGPASCQISTGQDSSGNGLSLGLIAGAQSTAGGFQTGSVNIVSGGDNGSSASFMGGISLTTPSATGSTGNSTGSIALQVGTPDGGGTAGNIIMEVAGVEVLQAGLTEIQISCPSGTVELQDGAGSSISLTDDTNVNVNCGGLFSVSSSIGIQPPQFSKAGLPTLNVGAVIYVTDATRASGTGTLAFCDGTNWIDVTTGLPVV